MKHNRIGITALVITLLVGGGIANGAYAMEVQEKALTKIEYQKNRKIGEKVMFKKIVSIILCISLMSISAVTFAEEAKSKEMDTLDILIAASTYLNLEISTEECISEDTYLEKLVPLFNDIGEVVAYYATFSPTGYAVVNNNVKNPTVIEFGEGNNKTIEDILKEKSDYHIIYNNPIEIYEASRMNLSDNDEAPNGLFSWHWIISVGYRQYNSGGNYMRVMDNWSNTVDRYYKIGTDSLWWSATEYWVN